MYILSKSGLPVAAIVSMEDFNKLDIGRMDQLNSLVRDLGREAPKKNISEEKLEEMMKKTRGQVYKKIYEK